MLTEQSKEKLNRDKIISGIRLCEESITKAEKYERLKENKDWQGFLDDLKGLITLHDNEIRMGQSMLVDAPNSGYVKNGETYVSSKKDWTDFIVRHQIQRDESQNWIKEPERILLMADLARSKLPMLKDKLSELDHAAAPVSNGKP